MLLKHVWGILSEPRAAWTRIRDEEWSIPALYISVIAPLALLSPVAGYIGTTTFGWQIGAGTPLRLGYAVQAINGLRRVRLIERGREVGARAFDAPDVLTPVHFTVEPAADTWYSLLVEDAAGRFLVSNPLWVRAGDVAEPRETGQEP